jgi:hypothetical protein
LSFWFDSFLRAPSLFQEQRLLLYPAPMTSSHFGSCQLFGSKKR